MSVADSTVAPGAAEAERLRALITYEVLDTAPDEHFDALARLAARLCHCPIALITLLDEERQWFKAVVGLDLRETPRHHAFCAHTIRAEGIFQVPDARDDGRFSTNPLVVGEPHLRFYAGVPLAVEGGHKLGALAVLDRVPRKVTPQEASDLASLARQVVLALEERRLRLRAERTSAEVQRQSDSLLAIAGRVARLGAWELDVAEGRVTWSDVVADIHGMPRGYAPDLDTALAFYVEPDRTELAVAADACIRHGTSFDHELVLQPANGVGPRWVRSIGEAVRSPEGQVTHLRGACQDITERKRNQLERQRLTDRLVATLESIPDPFLAIGRDGTIEHANAALEKLVRTARGDLVGRRLTAVLPPQLSPPLAQRCEQAMATGEPAEFDAVDQRSGRRFEVRLFPIEDGLTIHARDITEREVAESERRALEQRLLQAQKMESIGTLAGGIAHDFNNVLGAILGNVSLARDAVPRGSPAAAALATITNSAQRARSLVQQILAFSSRQATHRVREPLGTLVEQTHRLLRSTLSSSIALRLCLPPQDVFAEIDRNQMQQVLINLCTNAWHALPPEGGCIEIGLDTAFQPLMDATQPAACAAVRCAHLWVRDDGCGIEAGAIGRVFEPFYSTKAPGEGTGLGLSVAHGIVSAHGGTICVESEPGVGTVFHIHLPLCEAPMVASDASPRLAPNVSLRGLRVLCVDDDPVMLMTMQALLEREGCEAAACLDGDAAMDCVNATPDGLDLLVTDFNMPGMDGLALVERVRSVRPDLPVVLASGFMSDSLAGRALAMGVKTLVNKERAVEDLVPAVKAELAALATSERAVDG
jgi:PAS domain S-box-containing protein